MTVRKELEHRKPPGFNWQSPRLPAPGLAARSHNPLVALEERQREITERKRAR